MTSSLPTGAVTFLFTDIEGSTELWEKHPEAMKVALAQHDALLRRVCDAHAGYVFKTVGDAFCVAFASPAAALTAALEAQRALRQTFEVAQTAKSSDVALRVRMGLHTGAAEERDRDYFGQPLNRVARLMSAGHGGQILLSYETAEALRDQLPAAIALRDMGKHRLKGLAQLEQLFQVLAPDLPADFPKLNTSDLAYNNLPTQLTHFIGREKEAAEVKRQLAEARLVTLTGAGGCGKTRLAIHVAGDVQSDFTHGVWLVELAPLADPALVPQTIIATFNLREDSHRTSLQVLTDYLRTKHMLLLLDNCEHVIDACAQLSESLLHACPQLNILASSREALGIAGELSYRVPSLSTPNPAQLPALERLADVDSIRLFLDRAVMVKPEFTLTQDNAAAITQICFRLDGIPLAIELAVARVKLLSPEQIAARLDDRFRLLTGGARTALPRQQTLRAMIDWSYSLLSEQEKSLFRRLAVFVGGWTLEAAEAICGEDGSEPGILDLLTRLVDKSLVNTKETAGENRYSRLETIRQYSREKFFETDEVEAIRNRHLAYYAQFAEEAEKQTQGRARMLWAQRFAAEQANLRAAMEWGRANQPERALQMAVNLVILMTSGGFSYEGFRSLGDGLENMVAAAPSAPPALRAKALSARAWVYLSLGDNLNAKHAAEQSIALYRQIDDKSGLAFALISLGVPLEILGELVPAERALQEGLALARAEKKAYFMTGALNTLGRVSAKLYGDFDAALRYADESIRISQEAGIEASYAYELKGFIAAQRGNYSEARALFEQALHAFEEIGAQLNVILNKTNLAHLERQFGNHQLALEYYRETIVAFRDIGHPGAVAHQLECVGFIALAQNQHPRALRLFAAASALREKIGTPMTPDEQVYYQEQLRLLREKIDPAEFTKAWEHGRAMTIDQAITHALESEPVYH